MRNRSQNAVLSQDTVGVRAVCPAHSHRTETTLYETLQNFP